MNGKATTTFVSQVNGLRVVPFNLFRTLRVRSVHANGQALAFIQEDKNDDADFSVILPKALAMGEKFAVTSAYEGKEAVTNEGGGNYFPRRPRRAGIRTMPMNPRRILHYDMTFQFPKE